MPVDCQFRRFWSLSYVSLSLSVSALLSPGIFADDPTPKQVQSSLHRAVRFFREEVSQNTGGYLWRYAADLSLREGEGIAKPTTAWLQPPGTPSVGESYLRAYQRTGDPVLKEAMIETAMALVYGQLQSGGWTNHIEFDAKDRKRYRYRKPLPIGEEITGKFNRTTFDDDKSQSALRFLMKADRELEFKNEWIHEACTFALESFVKAQYPNGAWPQQYDEFPRPKDFPVVKANYPETWPREYPGKRYTGYYTLNDGNISKLIETMLLAAEIYPQEHERYRASALKAGDFFLLAQMPEPQPGWAQQYNKEMQPAWARKFEPPAITGGESQGVMFSLLLLSRETGEERFLAPLEKAIAYYNTSKLENGRLARFYELQTNRPLFFTKDYQLTYSADDLPTHYGFIVSSKLDRIEKEYRRLKNSKPEDWKIVRKEKPPRMTSSLRKRVQQILADMDERGAWVELGELKYHKNAQHVKKIIDPRTFCENIETLAEYLAALKKHDSD